MKSEDLLLDDSFLAWYFRSDEAAWAHWEEVRTHDPVMRSKIAEAAKLLRALTEEGATPGEKRQADVRSSLMERIEGWERGNQHRSTPRYLGRRRVLWSGVAASLVLMIYLGYRTQFGSELSEVQYEAGNQTRKVELRDGSIVDLNAGASIKTVFQTGKTREVWLEGEAYFHVAKQSGGEKFVVHSQGVDVEVLGTEFNVRSGDERTEVVLESGKVKLHLGEQAEEKVLMKPGERVEFDQKSRALTRKDVNTLMYTSWKDGKAVFENAGVGEIAQILSERYSMEVETEPGTELGEFNGVFPIDDPDLVVMALKKAYPGRVVQKENRILFKK